MFSQENSSGISVAQAKKDAKKLAKNKSIRLSAAQDEIAFRYNRSSWAEAMAQMKMKPLELCFDSSEEPGVQKVSLPTARSSTILAGVMGSGKSTLLADCVQQFLNYGIGVTYIGYCGYGSLKDYKDLMFEKLKNKHGQKFQILDVESELNLNEVRLNGGVLVIDDFHYVFRKHIPLDVLSLIDCSKHTVFSVQTFEELNSLQGKGLRIEEHEKTVFWFSMMYRDIYKVIGDELEAKNIEENLKDTGPDLPDGLKFKIKVKGNMKTLRLKLDGVLMKKSRTIYENNLKIKHKS